MEEPLAEPVVEPTAAIREWVRTKMSPRRFRHTMGVFETVPALARRHGVDQKPLLVAALLHDCARELPEEELLELAGKWSLPIREEDRLCPLLLHGRVAAEMGKRKLGALDPATVSAVVSHTAGHPGMTRSDKVFFLADTIEPGRDFPGIEELRSAAMGDIDAAMLRAVEFSRAFLVVMGAVIDPDTIRLHEALRARVHGPRPYG